MAGKLGGVSIQKERNVWLAVMALLAVMLIQMVWMAHANSATWDEADHLYASYMQWKHGDFGLNPEHPPLVKFLAAAPLQGMKLQEPPLVDRPYRVQEIVGGREFLFELGNDGNAMLFRARMAASVLTLALGVLVFLVGQEMFGTAAGLVALALLAFDPTLMGHSALVTTDAGQALFLLGAIYAFYRYIKQPTAWRLVLAGLVAGLALASKHSAVLLFPMLVLLAAGEVWWTKSSERGRYAVRLAGAVVAIGVISVVVLWASYGFRYAARPDGLALNPTMAALLKRVPSGTSAAVLGAVDRMHLLPQSYTYGMAHVLVQSKAFASYVMGTVYPHPVWFYFPVAMAIKSTLTFLVLFAVSLWVVASGRLACTGGSDRVRARRGVAYMLVPAGVYMVFAMAGGMNIGVRHVLPVYVFLAVLIGGAASALMARDRRWMYGVVALLVFQAVSVLHAMPAYVSYANELWGGPAEVHRYLSDSSSDWGQQMKSVKRYLDKNGIKDCWFAYFGEGVADFSYYGIPCRPLITADSLHIGVPRDVPVEIDGPVLVSAGVLSGFEFGPGPLNAYGQFQQAKPVAVIDDGVFVYEGHFAIPLASALSHMQKSGLLLTQKDAAGALAEAQQAEALAPESAAVNAAMGRALEANGRGDEAKAYYQRALGIAQTVEPRFQEGLIAEMEKRLGGG